MTGARQVVNEAISEKEFQQQVRDFAQTCKWHVYHTHDSRRSAPGFPDLVLVRAPRLIFAELKTENGKVSSAQQRWLDDFDACGQETYVWRPSDLDQIVRILG